MLNIAIILSKYLFIFYIAFFLLNGFIASTNKDFQDKMLPALVKQRIMILIFHINAYLILLLSNPADFSAILTRGFFIFVFLFFGNMLVCKIYPNSSPILWNGVFFLSDIGIVLLQSLNASLAEKQLVWHIAGFVIALIIPALLNKMPRLDKFKNIYITISIILLLSTIIFGNEEFGSRNWISIGSFAFQPSEVVKILFITYLASALSQKPDLKQLIVPSVLCLVILLCFVMQKDLGSALIFFMSFMVVVYIATSKVLYFAGGLGIASLGAFIAYKIFPHIQVRVAAWINPWEDISNKGYQIAHSLFAIATYGPIGAGFTKGYATHIPVVERDFIFSAICEEFGTIFGICVILIFLMIFLEGAVGALNAKNRFLCLFCAGLTALIAFQTFVILGGVTKLIPLTGVTLPFISYGGTSILVCYALISIIQWVYQSCVHYAQRESKNSNTASSHRSHQRKRKTVDDDISLDEVLEYNSRRKKRMEE